MCYDCEEHGDDRVVHYIAAAEHQRYLPQVFHPLNCPGYNKRNQNNHKIHVCTSNLHSKQKDRLVMPSILSL